MFRGGFLSSREIIVKPSICLGSFYKGGVLIQVNDWIIAVITGIPCIIIGLIVGYMYRKTLAEAKLGRAEEEANRILREAMRRPKKKKPYWKPGKRSTNKEPPGREIREEDRDQIERRLQQGGHAGRKPRRWRHGRSDQRAGKNRSTGRKSRNSTRLAGKWSAYRGCRWGRKGSLVNNIEGNTLTLRR